MHPSPQRRSGCSSQLYDGFRLRVCQGHHLLAHGLGQGPFQVSTLPLPLFHLPSCLLLLVDPSNPQTYSMCLNQVELISPYAVFNPNTGIADTAGLDANNNLVCGDQISQFFSLSMSSVTPWKNLTIISIISFLELLILDPRT